MSSPSIVITRLLSLATLTTSATTAFATINASSSRRHIIINARNLVTAIATTTRTPSYAAATTRSFTTSSTATSAMSSYHEFDTGYLNAQDAADLDVELMSTPGFSLEQLMELAGLSVAEAVYEVADVNDGGKKKSVLLVCG
jgi:predicted choloylglycine hydrolase